IVVSIEGAECPTQAGDGDGGAEARADGGLGDGRCERGGRKVAFGESRGAHAGGERQPGKGLELVVDVEGFEIGGGALGVREGWASAAVIEDGAEELAITLVKAEKSDLQIVPLVVGGEA